MSVVTVLVFLAERTFTSEFWLFVLISDRPASLMSGFPLVNLAHVANVALLQFGKLFIVTVDFPYQWVLFH